MFVGVSVIMPSAFADAARMDPFVRSSSKRLDNARRYVAAAEVSASVEEVSVEEVSVEEAEEDEPPP